MNENETEILSKIKKLLDLADPERNGAEGEIQNAFTLAQKLLKKHHLSMSQVHALTDEESSTTGFFQLEETEVVKYAANILPKWMEIIIRSVNIITETKTLIKRSPRPNSSYGNLSIVFVGESLDVMSSTELFTFLHDTVSKMSTAHCKKNGSKHKFWRSFAEGCATTILERAQQLEKEIADKINKTSPDSLDVSSREITEDDEELIEEVEWEEADEEWIDEKLKNQTFSIELYNKYKENKYEKIQEYIDNMQAEDEKRSSRTSKIEVDSFQMGQQAGETIPLTTSKKLEANGKKRR